MGSEFLQKITSHFSNEYKQRIGLSLDEEPAAIEKALSALIPSGLMAALHHPSDSRTSVSELAASAAKYFPNYPDIENLHNEEAGSKIASDLLGKEHPGLIASVAKFAGIKKESAGALIMLVMPTLMHFLGTHARDNNLDNEGIQNFLSSQLNDIRSSVPSGFEPMVKDIEQNLASRKKEVVNAITTDSPRRTNKGWILPVILAILAVLLLVYFSRGCNTWLK